MGAKLSSSSSSLSKIKGIKINRDSSSPSNSATSSTISTSKSRTQKTQQILTNEQQSPSPRTSSTTSFDTRELPYATLKTEDDRMNAVCILSVELMLNITK